MAERKKKSAAVVNYIVILFLCAFFLMMMTYLMEQRAVTESIDGLRSSVSAMQTVDQLYFENDSLKEELNLAEKELLQAENNMEDLEEKLALLEESVENLEKTALAMDWFWQINQAYSEGKNATCLNLIESMEAEGLGDFLPTDSVNGDLRTSPAYHYKEMKDALELE